MALSNWQELLESAEESTEYSPLPEGEYPLVITETEVVQSSTGKTGFKTVSEVLGEDHAGRKVFNSFYISPESPKALGIFFRHMAALGLDSEYFASNPSEEDIADELLGAQFLGVIAHTQNDGKTYANIQDVKPLDGEYEAESKAPASKPTPKAKSSTPKPGTRRRTSPKLPTSPMNKPV